MGGGIYVKLYVSGATATLRKYLRHSDVLGYLATPATGNKPESVAGLGLSIAADNAAFSGFDAVAFTRMLTLYREGDVQLDWVACPDVVADAVGTFRQWLRWEGIIQAFGYKPCLVLQDGMTSMDMLDFRPPAVFIGGSTEWKLGPDARKITSWARGNGLPVHMGRVNSEKRIKYAIEIGCTSCDGSGFSAWPDKRIPKAIRWIKKHLAKGLFA